MRTMTSLAWRSLRQRPGRAVLTASGIAIGVALFFGTVVGNASTVGRMSQLVRDVGSGADVLVWPVGATGATMPASILDDVRALDGVAAAAGVMGFPTALQTDEAPDVGLQINRPPPALVVGLDARDTELFPMRLSGGDLYQDGEEHALVPRALAERLRVGVGAPIVVATPTGTASLTLTGLLDDFGAGRHYQGNVVYTSMRTAWRLTGTDGVVSQVAVQLRTGTQPGEWADAASAALGEGVSVQPVSRTIEVARRQLAGAASVLLVLAAGVVLVAGFLIYLTLTTAVAERVRTLGTLVALGATRTQIRRLVLTEAAVLASAGTAVGLPLGFGVAYGLGVVSARALTGFGEVTPVVPPVAVAASIALGVGASLMFAIVPARRAGALDPAVAMRGDYEASGRLSRMWIAGLFALLAGYLLTVRSPTTMRMVLAAPLVLLGSVWLVPPLLRPAAWAIGAVTARLARGVGDVAVLHLLRHRTRSAYTLALVMVVMAAALTVAATGASFTQSLDRQIDAEFGADLAFSAASTFDEAFVDRVRTTPGVADVSVTGSAETRVLGHAGEEPALVAFFDPSRDFKSYAWRDGDPKAALDALRSGGAVVFPARTASRLRLHVGEKVTLETAVGPRVFRIAATADVSNSLATIGMSLADGARFFRFADPSAVQVKVGASHDVELVRSAIQERVGDGYTYLVRTADDHKVDIRSQIAGALNAFYLLLLLAAVVGFLGLANTIAVTVVERSREIGVLRAIGAYRRQIRRMTLVESLTLVVVATILSLPLGTALSFPLLRFAEQIVGDLSVDYVYPWRTLPLLLIGGVLAAAVASMLPARRASGIEIDEALRFE